MFAAEDRVWFVPAKQTLQYRRWDDEYVLYNDLSGNTHLLGETAIVILQALKRQAATRDTLVAVLMQEFEADTADIEAEIDEMLPRMQRLALIDTMAC